jgi:hypothetical protein
MEEYNQAKIYSFFICSHFVICKSYKTEALISRNTQPRNSWSYLK